VTPENSNAAAGARRITVEVARPYDVVIGAGVLPSLPLLISEQRTALITDTNLAALYGEQLQDAFSAAGKELLIKTVPAGETSKDAATFVSLLDFLAASMLGRDAAIVGFGGGVITDLAGFVAASWLRGVAYYSVPTSLLGMVDAGVGGKTGLNLTAGKNLVGAFWQPRAVLMDVALLASLPEREFRHGAVEFFKHGLISDTSLLGLLGDPRFSRSGDPALLTDWLVSSVRVKAELVAADEREQGVRTWLNYGHTLAHALEGVTQHELAHGEAVAYGILYAALLGRARGLADVTPFALRLLDFVRPLPLPAVGFADLREFLQRDKKNTTGQQRFVLLQEPGRPLVVSDVSLAEQEQAWLELRQLVSGERVFTEVDS
jgi:3-dehydroquinate synthase